MADKKDFELKCTPVEVVGAIAIGVTAVAEAPRAIKVVKDVINKIEGK